MQDDFMRDDDDLSYKKTVALCVAAASLVVLLFLVVLYMNTDKKKSATPVATQETEIEEEDDFMAESHNFTSKELDFWADAETIDNDAEPEPTGKPTKYKEPDKNNNDNKDKLTKNNKDSDLSDTVGDVSDDEEDEENSEYDDADENHIIAIDPSGKKRTYELIEDLGRNKYDFEESLIDEDGILSYKDTKREALKGVDLSKYNGDIDFQKLKEGGVEFVMLRLGSRGYGTGLITLDEKFVDYAQNANLNEMLVGAYFYSQAITEAEAIEEANYIVGAINTFNVKYPVAIDIESVDDDDARTDELTVKERTAIVKAFCDTVKSFGYKPLIYAKRDMLIAGLDLLELEDYDVWLADYNKPTDYPYEFTMWQYTDKGKIEGVSGRLDMNLCFVNYEKR